MAIASSLQFYSRKHFRVHLYARPFGAHSHVASTTCAPDDYKVALRQRLHLVPNPGFNLYFRDAETNSSIDATKIQAFNGSQAECKTGSAINSFIFMEMRK
jgi:hypothetical protein